MIDIAFSKLAIIGAAALVFIGPERLPKVARMAGTLFGRAQRYINDVKSEVSREMELEELRKMHQDVQSAASDMERSIARNLTQTEDELRSVWDDTPADSQPGAMMSSLEGRATAAKSKDFRKKKLAHTSAVPAWYKHRSGQRSRVISGAARTAKYRAAGARKTSSFFS